MAVSGTNITAGTTVSKINSGTSFELSKKPSGTQTGETLTFTQDGDSQMDNMEVDIKFKIARLDLYHRTPLADVVKAAEVVDEKQVFSEELDAVE